MATIKNILKKKGNNVWTVDVNDTVYKALELMAEKEIGGVPVMENNKVVGFFSERDYARKVVLHGKASKSTSVSELMTTEIYFITEDKPVGEAMTLMNEVRKRHLPVMKEGKMIGIISIGDVVNMMIREQQTKIKDLENYIMGSAYT